MRQQKTIREKANRYFFTKIAVNALLIILAALLIAFSLHTMQRRASFTRQRQNSEMALTAAVSTLNGNTGNADELARVFHEGNQDHDCEAALLPAVEYVQGLPADFGEGVD